MSTTQQDDTSTSKVVGFIGAGIVLVTIGGLVVVLVPVLLLVMVASSNDRCIPGGDNGDAPISSIDATGERVWPMAEGTYTVTSEFGMRVHPVTGAADGHNGIDLAAPMGTPMYAAMDGVVAAAGTATGFGYWIVLDHNDDGEAVSTVYGHMETADDLFVSEGDEVHAGQVIALVGNGGTSTGPHLHFEVVPGGRLQGGQQIDPRIYLDDATKITASDGDARPDDDGDDEADRDDSDSDSEPDRSQAPSAEADPDLVADSRSSSAAVDECGFGGGGGDLDESAVPAEFVPWLRRAADVCEEFSAPLAGAQLKQESGFRFNLVSSAGALGPAQFMPGTWASYGYAVDDDGNRVGPAGGGDPNDIGAAVMAQAHYMCDIYERQRPMIESGQISGDPDELALAGYNAGEGAVQQYGGVPPFAETQHYVKVIRQYAEEMTTQGSHGEFVHDPDGDLGPQIVAAARSYIGQPYVWGGGDVNGPTTGVPHPSNPGGPGLDCSGLTTVAIYQASGGELTPPRTAEAQQVWGQTVPVDRSEVRAGDLLFSPGHVAIAVDSTTMIEAPTFGQSVTESEIRDGMTARRIQ